MLADGLVGKTTHRRGFKISTAVGSVVQEFNLEYDGTQKLRV